MKAYGFSMRQQRFCKALTFSASQSTSESTRMDLITEKLQTTTQKTCGKSQTIVIRRHGHLNTIRANSSLQVVRVSRVVDQNIDFRFCLVDFLSKLTDCLK
jgi:hypothetical protein